MKKRKNRDNYDENYVLSEICINSRYFESKLNLSEILGVLESTDDIAIFVDEKILPEINEFELYFNDYLEIVDAISYLAVYGKNNKIKGNELKSFVLIMVDLLYNNYKYHNKNDLYVAAIILGKNEIKTRNRSIEFLKSLNKLEEMNEPLKIKLLIDFVLNNYEKEKEAIKKSVMLSPEHIEKINQIEGKGFSAKVRTILDSYFAQNKTIVTEDEIISNQDITISKIYYELKEKILSWNKEIKFKPLNDYLTFSYYYRFLKLSFDKNKINLELSFSEDKPFEDYKSITKEIKEESGVKNKINNKAKNKIKKLNFSLDNYNNIEYALFLIKQSYENNNQDIHNYTAYNHSIHKLFNNIKRYEFPLNEEIPKNGIFVLFEKGEKFQDEDRIVYVGSNIKENRMPKMLNHVFKEGNRDNTVFRKNIGRSLLRKNDGKYFKKFDINISPEVINNWDMDLKEFNEEYSEDSKESKQIENIEEMVSDYMQNNFSFAIIEIDNKLKRLHLKSKIISSLSIFDEFKPSDNWLGHDSPREKIRKSGIWLEQHLGNKENQLTEEDIEFLKEKAKD